MNPPSRYPSLPRRACRTVDVGGVTLGGDAPVRIQSMTNTRTADADATSRQIDRLVAAGAELVRVAVPRREDTAALPGIVRRSPVPVIADVHFHFDRALEAIDAGAAKIRLNPGNIGDRDEVRRVIAAAKGASAAIRVGVNSGSVIDRRDGERARRDRLRPLHELMVDTLAGYLEVFEEERFEKLVLSAKSPDAVTNVACNRLMAGRWSCPLHLGVTHAGPPATAAIRSAAALGTLLCEGIGDTIRISFAGDPVEEVRAAVELLTCLRLRERRGVELLACPTCGRLETDVAPIVETLERALAEVPCDAPLTVAVMGCVVNGPGEAEDADLAVCCGREKALLYRRGEKVCTLRPAEIAPRLLAEVRRLCENGAENEKTSPEHTS